MMARWALGDSAVKARVVARESAKAVCTSISRATAATGWTAGFGFGDMIVR